MKVGSLVELVNDNWKYPHEEGITYPVKRTIYTVREIDFSDIVIAIMLEEIINPKRPYLINGKFDLGEKGFIIERFRELQPPLDVSNIVQECLLESI